MGAFFAFGSIADAQEPPAAAVPEVRPPQVVNRVDATYPESAKKDGRHADVVMNVTVDAEGKVSRAEVT
jgi:outer membrane biosynthesis protein TonB